MHIEQHDTMPEPAWSDLANASILADSGYRSPLGLLPDARRDAVSARMRTDRAAVTRFCFAAWEDDTLIGGTVALVTRPAVLFMQTSAVAPSHRRRGVYTALARHIIGWAREQGFAEVTSKHLATNNPILIAKLKLGFHIVGLELIPEWGTLVSLALPLDPSREALYGYRAGALPAPPE